MAVDTSASPVGERNQRRPVQRPVQRRGRGGQLRGFRHRFRQQPDQQFTTSGVFVNSFGGAGSGLGQFNTPKGITYDTANYWYVVDSGNNRVIQGLSSDTYGMDGTNGAGLAEFNGALNMSVGVRGVYVADTGNNRIQAFDTSSDGEYGFLNLGTSSVRFAISISLNHPAAVAAVDNLTNDMFYIADTGNNRYYLCRRG